MPQKIEQIKVPKFHTIISNGRLYFYFFFFQWHDIIIYVHNENKHINKTIFVCISGLIQYDNKSNIHTTYIHVYFNGQNIL